MTEIKKTLAILKARWPEATLIIGLNVLLVLSNKLFRIEKAKLTPILPLLFFISAATLMIIWILLNSGFLRTAYLEGDKRQPLIVLLKTGMRFFGRMFRLGLLWLLIYFPLLWLTYSATKPFASIKAGFFDTARSSPLLYQFYFTVPYLILIKPLLLMPAIIIVMDCKVLESFKFLKKCKLLDAKGLLILVLISIILNFSWTILPKLNESLTISQFLLKIFSPVLMQFIRLMIAVTAVRFVASLNLVYDIPSVEDSQKHTNGNLKE